ncbi:MAG: neutral/alkaline non-lysosomal ceramidase N-terminal domain-containing protein [Planctomycetes bacterium]|nr:neutral/alkaline non-lysosomal ceramidase N-terminal domain-containing protein [Planctomycetota bacterium]
MAGLLCVALLSLAGCAQPTPRSVLVAGVAAVDITPDWQVPLGGYGARLGRLSQGTHDPIFAKALYLETPDARVVLVTTDLIGSLRNLRDAVRAELPPDLHLILAASHTHSAPGALIDTKHPMLLATVGRFDPKLLAWLRERLLRVIGEAIQARAPATFSIGSSDVPEFCRSRRRDHYPTGSAPVDPALGVIRIGPAQIVNYAAHPTVLDAGNMRISGDWPGALQRHLEVRGVKAMFTNGAEGDVAPRTPGGADDFDKCERMGAALAERVWAVPLDESTGAVSMRYVEHEVDLPAAPSFPWVKRTVLGVLRINDAAFVCVPGELSAELGLELKERYRRLGYRHMWVLGLANDHLFYILSEDQYRKGGYERSMSFYGPRLGPWLVDRFEELGRLAQDGP